MAKECGHADYTLNFIEYSSVMLLPFLDFASKSYYFSRIFIKMIWDNDDSRATIFTI